MKVLGETEAEQNETNEGQIPNKFLKKNSPPFMPILQFLFTIA